MDSGRLIFNAYPGNMIFIGNNDPVFRGSRSLFNVEDTLKKRPFYSSPDELVEEEFYDEQVPEKKRRLTPEQVHILERSFEAENKLEPERKSDLAKKLGLQPRQVAVWFQNRRARWKTKQLEHEYDLLKSSYHSLLADHDNLAKDNEKLKSEVISLVEKLQAKEAGEKGGQLQENGKIGVDVKIEDHLSSGSVESAVVDEDGRQLIDSGASYFPDYGCCMGVERIQSEEEGKDDLCVDRRIYFSDGYGVAGQHQQQEEVEDEQLGWLVWF